MPSHALPAYAFPSSFPPPNLQAFSSPPLPTFALSSFLLLSCLSSSYHNSPPSFGILLPLASFSIPSSHTHPPSLFLPLLLLLRLLVLLMLLPFRECVLILSFPLLPFTLLSLAPLYSSQAPTFSLVTLVRPPFVCHRFLLLLLLPPTFSTPSLTYMHRSFN